jgi:membrane-associated phospholipid phosphatase
MARLFEVFWRTVSGADVRLFKIINSCHGFLGDWIFGSLSYLANAWVLIPLSGLVILLRTPKRDKIRCLAVAALAFTLGGLADNAIKQIVDRPRPISYFRIPGPDTDPSEPQTYKVHVLGEKLRVRSMPSGHTNIAFIMATLAVLIFGRRWWPAFMVAAAVGYSRVYVGVHFPLDTVIGAVTGTGTALAVWTGARLLTRRRRTES